MGHAATRRAAAAAGIAVLAGALLAGCGGAGAGQGGTEGWGTLSTDRLTVSYPKGWRVLPERERGRNDAAATLTRDGVEVGRIGVQIDFMTAADSEMAALGAAGTYVTGGRTKSKRVIEVPGSEDARRVEYHDRESTGDKGTPSKGTKVRGTDVVGMDGRDEAFLVRINAVKGELSASDVDRIVESISVR